MGFWLACYAMGTSDPDALDKLWKDNLLYPRGNLRLFVCMFVCMYVSMYACMYLRIYLCTEVGTDGRTDGRTEGWMDGWMDGWMLCLFHDERTHIHIHAHVT